MDVALIAAGWLIGAWIYAITGWPPPGLIDKSEAMPAASDATPR